MPFVCNMLISQTPKHNWQSLKLRKFAQAVTLWTHIKIICDFIQSLQANNDKVPYIRPRLLPLTFFPIYYLQSINKAFKNVIRVLRVAWNKLYRIIVGSSSELEEWARIYVASRWHSCFTCPILRILPSPRPWEGKPHTLSGAVKISFFWNATLSSLAEGYGYSKGSSCLHHQSRYYHK